MKPPLRLILLVLLLIPSLAHAAARDDAEILALLTQKQCNAPAGEPYVVVMSETHALSKFETAGLPSDSSATKDLIRRNRVTAKLPLPNCAGIKIASAKEIELALSEHPKDSNPVHRGWEGFYARYPGALGLRYLTLPGYSDDGTEALVLSSGAAGSRVGSGFLVRLKKSKGQWQIVSTTNLWVS